MLRPSARFFLPLTAVNETGQWPLDLLTACQLASQCQPASRCVLVVALRIWGIFPESFFVACGRILENISFRPLPMLFDSFFSGLK